MGLAAVGWNSVVVGGVKGVERVKVIGSTLNDLNFDQDLGKII